jgi:NAD-dependent deacetylase
MLVAGSSLEVVPVADLPLLARHNGARLIIVNIGETYMDGMADVLLRGDVAEVLPRLTSAFLDEGV